MSALSPLIALQSGVLGSTIYSHNQHGPYTRPRVVPFDPVSFRQTVMRSRLTGVSTSWAALPLATKTAWDVYGAAVDLEDRIGQTIHLTGRQEYFRTNLLRRRHFLPDVTGPPTVLRRVAFTPIRMFAAIGPPILPLHTAWNTADEWWVPGGYLLIKYSFPVPLTVNFYVGTFPRHRAHTFPTLSPFIEAASWWNKTTQAFFARAQVTTPDGRTSFFQTLRVVADP